MMNRLLFAFMFLLMAPALAQNPSPSAPPAELYHGLADKKDLLVRELAPGLSAGVLLEMDATYFRQGESEESDLTVATFEVDLTGQLVDWATGQVNLYWEQAGGEPMEVDVATITLGASETIPYYLQAGRLYVPFGVFNTHFVSDPLPQDLGETRETTAMIGYENDCFHLRGGVFNGDRTQEAADKKNNIDNGVAALTLTPAERFECGAYWLSDLGESFGLRDTAWHEGFDAQKAGGVGAYLSWSIWKLVLEGEIITATKELSYFTEIEEKTTEEEEVPFIEETNIKPLAWNTEIAFLPAERWEFAARLGGSDDFPGRPEWQYGLAGSYGLMEGVSVKLEYLRGQFKDDDDSDTVTGELAMEF
ncbi:MAG: LbtU family siderophore porin [Lentisphaerota bacterium]